MQPHVKSSKNIQHHQSANIVLITFWSQFAAYAINTILILFLTRPMFQQGLGYSQATAYAFFGVTQATGYLMPLLGGWMADRILGVRRAILAGSVLLALAYLMVMLSSYSSGNGQQWFIAAYACIPAANSLLMGTASSMVSKIYEQDAIKAKSAMTYYYMAINVGSLLAIWISPILLDSPYGPLSVFTIAFIGKSLAAYNFARRYTLYDNLLWGADCNAWTPRKNIGFIGYLIALYSFTFFAYSHVQIATYVIALGCMAGMGYFLWMTLALQPERRRTQLMAMVLIIEAIAFFVLYNQMSTTLILFAKSNSNLKLFTMTVLPAHYQLLNALFILLFGAYLPRLYKKFPHFSIPRQFAAGTCLAGLSFIVIVVACVFAQNGRINGNAIGCAYVLLTLGELWVSAMGLSMIGLYCDAGMISISMGVWYLAMSLSNTLSGQLGAYAAIAPDMTTLESLAVYQHYYACLGIAGLVLGALMWYVNRYLVLVHR